MKLLFPVAALAACGAGIAAFQAGTARADPSPRPMMVAAAAPHLWFPRMTQAAPQPDGGATPPGHPPSPAELAAQQKRMCQDAYAHQVGELAYLEARLELTAAQRPLFDRWKNAKLDIARRGEAGC